MTRKHWLLSTVGIGVGVLGIVAATTGPVLASTHPTTTSQVSHSTLTGVGTTTPVSHTTARNVTSRNTRVSAAVCPYPPSRAPHASLTAASAADRNGAVTLYGQVKVNS